MPYSVPADVEAQIDKLIASGDFVSADEVLRNAVTALALRKADMDAIREGIEDWKAGRCISLDDFVAEMRSKYDFLASP